jgi:hypothetical protein
MSAALTKFFGGAPAAVVLRLALLSFIVGFGLVTFGFEPEDIVASAGRAFNHLLEYGLADLRHIGRVLAAGALIVVPLWLISRLLGARGVR